MEDHGHSSHQAVNSNSDNLKEREFKLPANYNKFKKEAQKASDFSSLITYLNEQSSKTNNITAFCRRLLKYKGFNSFKTIHFFKHEKGQSFAQKFEVAASQAKVKDFHVNEFNQLFQRIKKSKNRTFGQESLKGFNFDILGTFLAREFSLGNHNVILIVSRNDFLTQTKEEKQSFSKASKVIAPYFDIILNKELEIQQLKNIDLALRHLPFKVDVQPIGKEDYKKLPSGRHFKIQREETLDQADIFHQERIALLGELLNTLKHELSNPLFGLQLSADLLLSEIENPESAQFMKEIRSSIKRSQSII
ncbi:MAG: histidine kinase dimerization/phospho-acceptor domain-containing protein, partial [Bacteriovoracaceae bacterium]